MTIAERRYEWLDYARFFAAIGVMVYHYTVNGYPDQDGATVRYFPLVSDVFAYGYLGVDLFFIISGYVIVQSAFSKTAGQFLASRILRLYPAFLTCVCITTSIALATHSREVTLQQFVANLTMMPMRFGQPFIDGVYWSLTYELFFYACIFFIISAGLRRHLNTMIFCWSVIAFVAYISGYKPFFFSGYFTLFFGGCALYFCRENGGICPLVSLAICAVLSAAEAFARHHVSDLVLSSPLIAACIVGAFFVTIIGMQHVPHLPRRLPISSLLGALSYPIYLLHFEIGIMLMNRMATPETRMLALASVSLCILLASLVVVKLVEVPTQAALRGSAKRYIAEPFDRWTSGLGACWSGSGRHSKGLQRRRRSK